MHGFGARLGSQIATALGIRTADELREAAAAGTAARGARHRARAPRRGSAQALERGGAAAERPLLLHRARALSEQLAAALGGIAAGDPRRWRDAAAGSRSSSSTERPDEARAQFQALPEIVTLAAPDLGVTLEGVPVELVLARPGALGTALVRATGSPEYVASLGPLPEAPDEETVYRLLGLPYLPPELRELPAPPGEPPRARRGRRRSAATSTATPSGRTARRPCSRWARRHATRLRVPRDLRPHEQPAGRAAA